MLFNKNNMRKVNDKKILHKVGKQWKVMSVALLMAIGGGAAVATHANADTTTPNTGDTNASNLTSTNSQSQGSNAANVNVNTNGINASTSNEIASLEANPGVSTNTQSAASSNATSTSNTPSSAPSSVSYLDNNGGSAASYHAKALEDSSDIHVNQARINDIKAQNAQLASKDVTAVSSATQQSNDDAALAGAFGKLANNSAYNDNLVSLATNHGLTVNDYVNSLSYNYNMYSSAMSSGTTYMNQLDQVASAKNVISSVVANKTGYSDKAAIASANVNAASVENSVAQSTFTMLQNESNSYSTVSANNYIARLDAHTNDQIALINSGMDSGDAQSVATSLGYKDASAIDVALSSYAKNYNGKATSYVFSNAKSSAVTIASNKANNSAFSDINRIISDDAAMSNYSNMKYSTASSVPDNVMQSASNAASSASANLSAAKSAYSSASVLADISTGSDTSALNSLVGNSDSSAIQAIGGLDSSATSSYITSASNSLSQLASQSNSYRNANNNYYGLDASLASSYAKDAASDKAAVSTATSNLNQLYDNNSSSEYSKDVKALAAAQSNVIEDAKLANAFGIHVYNYGPKYISVVKNLRVHTSTHYTDNNAFANISKGSILRVLGVGFDANGMLRYTVSVNGQQGFITGDPDYTQSTYLLASSDHSDVNIKAVRDIREFRNGKYVKMIKAGTVLHHADVVGMPDSNFNNKVTLGAFSRVQLSNGDMVTANSSYVQLDNTNPTPVQPTPSHSNDNQPLVVFG